MYPSINTPKKNYVDDDACLMRSNIALHHGMGSILTYMASPHKQCKCIALLCENCTTLLQNPTHHRKEAKVNLKI